MTHDSSSPHHERQVLHHEAWPGYCSAFYAVFALFTAYLFYLLFNSFGHH